MSNKHQKLSPFYLAIVLLFMLILPLVSIIAEVFFYKEVFSTALAGKWFLFWAIGVRLFTAGCKQALHPEFTAKNIFHMEDEKSFMVVKELGFANICLGTIAILSFFLPQGRILAAIGGGLFFGIAGIGHLFKKLDGPNEMIALVSDLFVFVLMGIYLFAR